MALALQWTLADDAPGEGEELVQQVRLVLQVERLLVRVDVADEAPGVRLYPVAECLLLVPPHTRPQVKQPQGHSVYLNTEHYFVSFGHFLGKNGQKVMS